jgi:hypothetical protein
MEGQVEGQDRAGMKAEAELEGDLEPEPESASGPGVESRSDPGAATTAVLDQRLVIALVILGFAALGFGLAATSGLWSHLGSRIITGNVPDALHYSWWLGHTPRSIGRGQNPFQTSDLNWPQGVSAMNNTTLLLPAILLSPVSLLTGSLTTLNLLNVLAVPACAAAGYWTLRQVPWPAAAEPRTPAGAAVARLSQPAALIGAVAFAISPAIVNSLVGHVTIAFAPGLPILLGLSFLAWSDAEHTRRTGLLLGAAAAAQLFIGEEVLFQAGIAAILVLLVTALSRPQTAPAAARRLIRAIGFAFAVFLPIAAYPLHQQFFGALKQHGSPFLLDYFGADVTAFTTPTAQILFHSDASAVASAKFPGGIEEHLAYLGWPLLLTCLVTAVLGWRRLPIRCAGVALAVALALSLGGRLWINGDWTEKWGPYRLFQKLPVTEASLATRFGLLAALFAGALLAFAVQSLTDRVFRRPAIFGPLVVLVSAVCLLPLLPSRLAVADAPAVPTYFTTTARSLPADSVIVVLPYPVASMPVAMRWQSAANYRFRMPGGYFLGPAQDGQAYVGGDADPPTAVLLSQVEQTGTPVVVTPEQRAQAARDLAAWGADQIVLGPSPAEAALRQTVTDLLGRAPQRQVGVDVWANLRSP